MRRVRIEPTFEAFRDAARRLLAEGVPPDAVDVSADGEEHQSALFGGGGLTPEPSPPSPGKPSRSTARVPKEFLSLARDVALHRGPDRWAVLYRTLWRLTHGEPKLLSIDIDPDTLALRKMEKEIRRDSHKMKAFVRFRKVAPDDGDTGDSDDPWYVAWHRPDHFIVPKVAPFFVERFNDQRWVILTPDASATWDRSKLSLGPGAPRDHAPDADELEDLWRTYYANIFNPARLKIRAMVAELPKRHWATLPEAELIPGLVRQAKLRTARMLEDPAHPPARSFFPEEPTLSALEQAVHRCHACPLASMGRAVFGEGPSDAPLALVGEQPGDVEERTGRPFVGPAGQVLDAALEAVGLDRRRLYVTNTVKHFSHEVRETADGRGVRRLHQTPDQTEVSACLPWLEEELAQLRPEAIVCLGATAARAVVGGHVQLRRDRGQVFETAHAPWTLVTYHPAALLRVPDPATRERMETAFRQDLARASERFHRGARHFGEIQ